MAEFKPGDVVQLKSGGPKMTVHSVYPGAKGPAATCLWFTDGDVREVKQFDFYTETLELGSEVDARVDARRAATAARAVQRLP